MINIFLELCMPHAKLDIGTVASVLSSTGKEIE